MPAPRPSYLRVFLTFARNSLVRDMTFRSNFIIESISSMSWMLMNLGFYLLIFQYVPMIGDSRGEVSGEVAGRVVDGRLMRLKATIDGTVEAEKKGPVTGAIEATLRNEQGHLRGKAHGRVEGSMEGSVYGEVQGELVAGSEGRFAGTFEGRIARWGQYQFFLFLATTMFVNSLVQAFFMPNIQEFSELIRRGGLDFALLKPIDTQFLISLHRVNWSSLSNFCFGAALMAFSLWKLDHTPTLVEVALYIPYVIFGVVILYSLMISLAATSIWLGRNQSLYNFWFYITNFSRYPMEIYRGRFGTPLRNFFTFVVPVLVVVNVPARFLAMPLEAQNWQLVWFAIIATLGSLLASRWVFTASLNSYRSASS